MIGPFLFLFFIFISENVRQQLGTGDMGYGTGAGVGIYILKRDGTHLLGGEDFSLYRVCLWEVLFSFFFIPGKEVTAPKAIERWEQGRISERNGLKRIALQNVSTEEHTLYLLGLVLRACLLLFWVRFIFFLLYVSFILFYFTGLGNYRP